MTQPALHSTFDTSLIDLAARASFSTTESIPSEPDTKADQSVSQTNDENPIDLASTHSNASNWVVIADSPGDEMAISRFIKLLDTQFADSRIVIGVHDHLADRKPFLSVISASCSALTEFITLQIPHIDSDPPAGVAQDPRFHAIMTTAEKEPLSVISQLANLRSRLEFPGAILVFTNLEALDKTSQQHKEQNTSLRTKIEDAARRVGYDIIDT